MIWNLVESIIKEPWKVRIQTKNTTDKYSRIRQYFLLAILSLGYWIGTGSAAHTALLRYHYLVYYLRDFENVCQYDETNFKRAVQIFYG